jgi:hypothetical protein
LPLRHREISHPRYVRYLGALAGVVFAVVEDAFDLAAMAFGTNGKYLFSFFNPENADVLGFFLYYKPAFRGR